MAAEQWDVAVAGLGPTGCVLALLCARRGLRVLAVEAAREPYPHPRAVAVDDDVLRVLTSLVPVRANGWQRAGFVDAKGRLLLDVGFGETDVGHPALAFVHQPSVERSLREALAEAGVTVRLGERVELVGQDEDGVSVRCGGRADVDRARFLVACDGTGSSVRAALGVRWLGRDDDHSWLVVDAAVPEPLAATPYFAYLCDPARPGVTMPFPGGHRWEWRLRPGETLDPAALLPPEARVLRSSTYTFSARRAERWRVGRVLLAGDAAHTMPPFAGQGMGAGVQDAAQLAWRLAELCGRGPVREPDPLDAWERERTAHVRQVVRLSRLLGALVTTPRAAARDRLLAAAGSTPVLGPWLRAGGPRPPSGPRLPSPRVRDLSGQVARLDDVVPWEWSGFRSPDAPHRAGDLTVVAPGGRRGSVGAEAVEDLDGTLVALLRRRGGRVTARPDRLLA